MLDENNVPEDSILLIKPDVFRTPLVSKSSQRLKMTKPKLKNIVRKEIILHDLWLRDSGLLRPACYMSSLKYTGVKWNTAKRWQNDHSYQRVIPLVVPLERKKKVMQIEDESIDDNSQRNLLDSSEGKGWLKDLFS